MGTPRNGDELARDLLSLKKELEGEKEQRAVLQGELQGVMRQLKEEFEVETLEEAKALIATNEKKLTTLRDEIETQITEIEEMMDPDDEE